MDNKATYGAAPCQPRGFVHVQVPVVPFVVVKGRGGDGVLEREAFSQLGFSPNRIEHCLHINPILTFII